MADKPAAVDKVVATELSVPYIERLEAQTGRRYELANGQLVEKPMATPGHSQIIVRLVSRIGNFVEDHDLGAVYESSCSYVLKGTHQNPELVYIPDFSFVDKARVNNKFQGFYELAPSLAVEVISPSERAGEMKGKVDNYLAAGVQEVWQVFPENKKIIVYSPNEDPISYGVSDTLTSEEILPGFQLSLAQLFR